MKKIFLMIAMILSVSQIFGQDIKQKYEEIKPQKREDIRRKNPTEKGWDGSIKALFATSRGTISNDKTELALEKDGTLSKKSELEIRKLLSVGKTKIKEVKLDKENDIPYLIMSGTQGKTEMKIVGQIMYANALTMYVTYKYMIMCGGSCAGSVYSSGNPFNCAIVGHGFKKWCNCDSGCRLQLYPFDLKVLNAAAFTLDCSPACPSNQHCEDGVCVNN